MAFPLKSGADLYNQQLIRAAIWNYSAEILDPKEYVTGLMYFNTNSGSNLYQKLRFRTGTEWKTIAFEEDLDVANNAEFKALEDKVKLLAGEVDTDAIISNMKEVSNFLAGFAEDAKLMDVLSNVPKALFTNDLNPLNYTSRPLFITAFRIDEGTTADYGTLIVPTWSENSAEKYYLSELRFPLGVAPQFRASFNGEASDWKTIAFTDSNVASATKLETQRTIWGQSFDGTGNVNGNLNLNLAKLIWHGAEVYSISCPNTATAARLQYDAYDGHLFRSVVGQVMLINSSGNVTIGGRDLAGTNAKLYVDGSVYVGNKKVLERVSNNLHIGEGIRGSYDTSIFGTSILFNTSSGDNAMMIAIGGNVGIGTLAPQHKLHVAGDIATDKYLRVLAWEGYGEGSCDMWFDGTTSNLKMGSRLHVAYDIQADGNIVANGTIACKGIAAEGDAMDMVDKTVLYIIPNGTQQTFTLNHGLGTREITISIYEITSMGTNMILTDVEIVDDNNISVSFGNPPTENHMVVVMG